MKVCSNTKITISTINMNHVRNPLGVVNRFNELGFQKLLDFGFDQEVLSRIKLA